MTLNLSVLEPNIFPRLYFFLWVCRAARELLLGLSFIKKNSYVKILEQSYDSVIPRYILKYFLLRGVCM